MARSSAAEVSRRVDAVYDLLLQGVSRRGIKQYAAQQGWAVSPRQIATYLSRAREELAAQAQRERAVELGKALEQLDLLFMKALAAEDRGGALTVLRERVSLLGLTPAARLELAGPGGVSGPSMAERSERFLAEFERQAQETSGEEGS